MSSSAIHNAPDAAAGVGGSSPHITKHNIDGFDYFQLFNLVLPAEVGNGDAVDISAVRRVYRRLSLRFHPDKDDSDAARHAFGVVHTALETIIDPVKREAYVISLTEAKAGSSSSTIAGSAEDLRQRQRAQQAQEEAHLAADLLHQREQQRQAKEAATRQAAQEREAAAQRLLSELTSTLNTPFQQMEAELVREWDVDAEMVAMKLKEVMKLLQQLAPADHTRDASELVGSSGVANGGSRKRDRVSAEDV